MIVLSALFGRASPPNRPDSTTKVLRRPHKGLTCQTMRSLEEKQQPQALPNRPENYVVWHRNPTERMSCCYEADALTLHKHLPSAVVIPGNAEEVAAAVKILADARIPFTPRGAGTGLSGGALSLSGSVIFELARLNRILKLDYENRIAVVETGVINIHLSQATSPHGFHYAPDPSSQMACTIGGNIAENSGGRTV